MNIINTLSEISKNKIVKKVKEMKAHLEIETLDEQCRHRDEFKVYDECLKIMNDYGTKEEWIKNINKLLSEIEYYENYYNGHYTKEVFEIIHSILEMIR